MTARRPVAGWLLAAALAAAAAGQIRPAAKAGLSLEPSHTAYEPGTVMEIAALVDIDEAWHTNSNEPTFDYLIPTELTVEAPAGWTLSGIDYPPGELKKFAFESEPLSVYEGKITLPFRLQTPPDAAPGPRTLSASLRFQACDDRSCLPPTSVEALTAVVVGPDGTARPQYTSATRFRAPQRRGGPGLAWILLLGLTGGLILNAMPCVLPVLSLKLFGLIKSAGQGRREVTRSALTTALGILLSFWGLAIAAIVARRTGAAVGWGIQFQNPVFVTLLAAIVVLFSLNLWGVFEIRLPTFAARAAGAGERQNGFAGHLVSGLFATLMATPCSAPFLGPALGFALSQSDSRIAAVFTAAGLGMALPYIAVAIAPRSIDFLPKPGPWMETLRTVMGFLLAGAAVWLFYVLSAQISAERLAFVELCLLATGLFVWLRHRAVRPSMRLLALLCVLATVGGALFLARQTAAATPAAAESAASLIPWRTFDRDEVERLAGDGRLVFVDVTADWCFTCKVNEKWALETPEVASAFERFDVVAMKADWTNRSDSISRYLADHGRYSIPFYLLYRPGDEPHLFSEVLTRDAVVSAVERAAASAGRSASRPAD